MAKLNLISGQLKIQVAYNDRGHYQVKLCPLPSARRSVPCQKIKVGVPAHIERAVDSPISMRKAARAAISFSNQDISDMAGSDADGNWVVRTPRNIRGPRRRRR